VARAFILAYGGLAGRFDAVREERLAAHPHEHFAERLRIVHADHLKRGHPLDQLRRISEHHRALERLRAMSTADVEIRSGTEMERVEQWRHELLARAGYDRESAVVLAASHEVDLHSAVALLERGCTIDLALQILL
jgi:hypothetical protein